MRLLKNMNRDDLIIKQQPNVANLVRKYNDGVMDEDLLSVGMIAVIECVDRSLNENIKDEENIKARCIVWARNRILSEIYKEKLKYVDDSETELETAFSSVSTDDVDLQLYLDKVLTKKQKEFLDLILTGYDREEIKKKMNIEKSMYYKLLSSITQKIKGGKND